MNEWDITGTRAIHVLYGNTCFDKFHRLDTPCFGRYSRSVRFLSFRYHVRLLFTGSVSLILHYGSGDVDYNQVFRTDHMNKGRYATRVMLIVCQKGTDVEAGDDMVWGCRSMSRYSICSTCDTCRSYVWNVDSTSCLAINVERIA